MFLRRYTSPTIFFERFTLGGKNSTIPKKRVVLKSKDNPENKNLIPWQNFN
jgi:hypothetical protein